MENKSLGGNATPLGITKKTVATDYHNNTFNGVFWKTASFAITNDRIRNCKDGESYKLINKKMLDEHWNETHDITKDYNNKDIQYKPIYIKTKDGFIHRIIDKYKRSLPEDVVFRFCFK